MWSTCGLRLWIFSGVWVKQGKEEEEWGKSRKINDLMTLCDGLIPLLISNLILLSRHQTSEQDSIPKRNLTHLIIDILENHLSVVDTINSNLHSADFSLFETSSTSSSPIAMILLQELTAWCHKDTSSFSSAAQGSQISEGYEATLNE